jgi:hypothetical protein
MNGCYSGVITDNQIYLCGDFAIMYECPGSTGPTSPYHYEGGVIANNVINIAGIGISVTNGYYGGRRVTVSGNHIKTMVYAVRSTTDPNYKTYSTPGAGIVAESDVVVANNIIEDCAAPGIVTLCGGTINSTTTSVMVVTGNIVKNAPIGIGFFKDGAHGSTMIQGNVLQGCTTGSVMAILNSCTNVGCAYPAEDGIDWGRQSGGLYTGKPYANVMIGLNFAT